MRPNKDKYYLHVAESVARRSTCLRRRYGAVIVKNDRIVSSGYNGSPRGEVNCCDTGKCVRAEMNVPHGERYELCCSVHAEQNAIIQASAEEMDGAVLYLYGYDCETETEIAAAPCMLCERFIKNAGIKTVVASVPVQEKEIA